MANWFECKVRYDKMMENGAVKKVNEPYLVDALSFTEAEARIIEERTPSISGDFNVSAVKRTKIAEIFWDEADSADRFYLVKVALHHHRREERCREKGFVAHPGAGRQFQRRARPFSRGHERHHGRL